MLQLQLFRPLQKTNRGTENPELNKYYFYDTNEVNSN